jgi:hypothetical protein
MTTIMHGPPGRARTPWAIQILEAHLRDLVTESQNLSRRTIQLEDTIQALRRVLSIARSAKEED